MKLYQGLNQHPNVTWRVADVKAKETPLVRQTEDYIDTIISSRFCLTPRGDTISARRVYEAIMAQCVPVLITDDQTLAWERVLDYSKFSVSFPESWLDKTDKLMEALLGISDEVVKRKRQEMERIWTNFYFTRGDEANHSFYAQQKDVWDTLAEELWLVHQDRVRLEYAMYRRKRSPIF